MKKLSISMNKPMIVLTAHIPSNVDNHKNLKGICQALVNLKEFTIVFSVHPRIQKNLEESKLLSSLEEAEHIILSELFSYLDFLQLMQESAIILTDSGGLSKVRVTHSYVLLTIGLAAIVSCFIWCIYDYRRLTKRKSYFLQPQGKNALLLFIFQPIFTILLFSYLSENLHVALVFLIGFINIAIIWGISYFLDKKKIYLII